MSKSVSALNGQSYAGFADVAELGLCGMVAIRCDLGSKTLSSALKSQGFDVPAQRQITAGTDGSIAWMGPDELLILCDYANAPALHLALTEALAAEHALVTNVSDARAVFRVAGPKADQVLQKLCPVDLPALKSGEIRRTRAAQVAVALWRSGAEEITLVSFRSVAGYVMGLLEISARPGGELA